MNIDRRWVLCAAITVTGALCPACGSTGDRFTLDREERRADPRYDDLRRRLNVDVRVLNGASSWAPCSDRDGCEPDTFAALVSESCDSALRASGRCGAQDDCSIALCNVERDICTAHRLLEYSTHAAGVETTLWTAEDEFFSVIVLPQDAETAADLSERAFRNAAAAVGRAGDALRTSHACVLDRDDLAPGREPESGLTVGRELAHFYVEGYQVALEAAEEARTQSLSVADAEYARERDLGEAGHLAFVAPFASRASASHLLVGGADGLRGMGSAVDEHGPFPHEPLSRDGQTALTLLRIAAPPPTVLRDDAIDASELITGFATTSTGEDSLRRRLGVILGDPTLEVASAAGFYDRIGVPQSGWVEARQWLASESRTFARSADHRAPPHRLANGEMTNAAFELYAATRMSPRPIQPAMWSAIMRYEPNPEPWAGEPAPALPPELEPTASGFGDASVLTVAGFIDGANTFGRHLVSSHLLGDLADILGDVFVDAEPRVDGRVRACWYGPSSMQSVLLQVYGFDRPASDLRIALGRDDLECATRGVVDGAPCELPSFSYQQPVTPHPTSEQTGYPEYLEAWATLTGYAVDGPAEDAVLVSVLRPRAGVSEPGPGDYDAFVSILMPRPEGEGTLGYRYCTDPISIVPDLDETVAATMGSSPSNPARPENLCAGMPYADRLTLENELIDDGNGIESSWRHFMAAAREAADEADRLGEDLIRNGLELDQRSEMAIDELETACGVSLNLSQIGGLESLSRAVPAGSGGECDPGYILDPRGDLCILDPIGLARSMAATDEDAARLEACLGDSTTLPWAALGDRPLCIWEYEGIEDSTCRGRDSTHPCPFLATVIALPMGGSQWACEETGLPLAIEGVEPTPIAIARTLDVFTLPSPEDAPRTALTSTEYPCHHIARMRTPEGLSDLTAWSVLASPFMDAGRVGELSRRLGWSASAGDFSRVTFDGSTVFTTGSALSGVAGTWPCTVPPPSPDGEPPLCPAGASTSDSPRSHGGPLFCLHGMCGEPGTELSTARRADRARMNDLLARAVIAARLLGGQSLAGLRVPFYPRALIDGEYAVLDGADWSSSRPTADGTGEYFASAAATLALDRGGDDGGPWRIDLGELEATAQSLDVASATPPACGPGRVVLDTQIPASAEWTLCPYDRPNCVEVFDDQPDCDDDPAAYRNEDDDSDLPLLIRTLPREVTGTSPARMAARLWQREPSADQFDSFAWSYFYGRTDAISFMPAHYGHWEAGVSQLSPLTQYWRRSACGDLRGGACDFGDDGTAGRGDQEMTRVASESRRCPSTGVDGCGSIGCRHDTYGHCVGAAQGHDIDFHSTFDGNRAFIAPQGLSERDFLNGLELLCVAARGSNPDVSFGCDGDPPQIETMQDVLNAEQFLRCKASAIRQIGGMAVIRDLPARVAELLADGADGVRGDVSGEYGAQVSALNSAFVELRNQQYAMADTVDSLANAVRRLRNAVARSDIAHEIEDLTIASTVMDRVTSCVTASFAAVAQSNFTKPESFAGNAGVAIATCTNSTVQIMLASQISTLRHRGLELDVEDAFTDFDTAYDRASSDLTTAFAAQQSALEQIDSALARLRTTQDVGRRAVARAMALDTDGTGRHFAVDVVTRRRYATSLHRYREARRRAVRLAHIARVSLEQRLGMDLSTIHEDLTTVEAPATWVDSLCTMPAIDYDRIRAADLGVTGEREGDGSPFAGPAGYAGPYVGDYVRRLEQVFESYSFRFPFQDGTDTAVLSLRDDVLAVRAHCEADSPNLLYQSGHLDVGATETRAGWVSDGCDPLEDWPAGSLARRPSCVLASSNDTSTAPLRGVGAEHSGSSSSIRIEFGTETPVVVEGVPRRSVTLSSRRVQWVPLDAGVYRLSWFGAREEKLSEPNVDPARALRVVSAFNFREDSAGNEIWDESSVFTATVASEAVDGQPGWYRYWTAFELDAPTVVGVAIVPDYAPTATEPTYRVVELGALMLEDVSRSLGSLDAAVVAAARPGVYFDTTDSLTALVDVCEDTDGTGFREKWHAGRERLCPEGYGRDCPDEVAVYRRYWELSVPMSADSLQRGAGTRPAGFASGNFNYRIDRVGLNLVGTELRECDATTGSSCYASGNIGYSIEHAGPYIVRNALGQTYEAPITGGRIETARALAAERYIGNPLSSADRALIEPYMRREFRGRPLWGHFRVRLWHDGDFAFERLEDVQLVVDYRYWTSQPRE